MELLDFDNLPDSLEVAHKQILALKEELRNVIDLSAIAYDKLCGEHELERFKMKVKFKVVAAALKSKEAEVQKLNDAIDRYYCKLEKVW